MMLSSAELLRKNIIYYTVNFEVKHLLLHKNKFQITKIRFNKKYTSC